MPAPTPRDDSAAAARGYPSYDALWPLVSMGVLTPGPDPETTGPFHAPNGWTVQAPRRTRVAMIDISVAVHHPNLSGSVNLDLAFDLGSTRLGAFPYRSVTDELGDLGLSVETGLTDGLPVTSRLLTELIDRLSRNATPLLKPLLPATASEFSGHGTAMAGLIAGRPAAASGLDNDGKPGEIPLPFCGVDPNCDLIPISTSFDPDPEALCLAFLYAELIRADVVVLARIVPDPLRAVPNLASLTIGARPMVDAIAAAFPSKDRLELWSELAELIVRSSHRRPIVCAAGNENEEHGVYPANLAADDNGIISVSAINARGQPSSYSVGTNATVAGPSSDGEIFNRTEVRLDTRRHDYDPVGVPGDNDNARYSSFEIISCDVPGDPGYTAGLYQDSERVDRLRDYGSYFCRFGGTSAASALIAGFLSLGMTAGQLPGGTGGVAAKAWLLSKCRMVTGGETRLNFPVWTGAPLFPDDSP